MTAVAEAISESNWELIAAYVAAVAALGVLLIQARSYHRRFAEPVTAWIRAKELQGGTLAFWAVAGNAGGAAIYDCVATVGTPGGGCYDLPLFTVPPGASREYQLPVKPPSEGGLVRPQDGTVSVRFKDSAGRRWRRDATGKLHRVWRAWDVPAQAMDCE